MRPGYTPVERHPNLICHNASCSMKDPHGSICLIGMKTCRDRQTKPSTSNIPQSTT